MFLPYEEVVALVAAVMVMEDVPLTMEVELAVDVVRLVALVMELEDPVTYLAPAALAAVWLPNPPVPDQFPQLFVTDRVPGTLVPKISR